MSRETLYLSGPMSGRAAHNYPAFHDAAKRLRDLGYRVLNPAEIDSTLTDGWRHADYMRRDLKLLWRCDAVAMLPHWETSRGAGIEVQVAHAIGLPVLAVEEWLSGQAAALIDGRA